MYVVWEDSKYVTGFHLNMLKNPSPVPFLKVKAKFRLTGGGRVEVGGRNKAFLTCSN